jgi:hypothetical protein
MPSPAIIYHCHTGTHVLIRQLVYKLLRLAISSIPWLRRYSCTATFLNVSFSTIDTHFTNHTCPLLNGYMTCMLLSDNIELILSSCRIGLASAPVLSCCEGYGANRASLGSLDTRHYPHHITRRTIMRHFVFITLLMQANFSLARAFEPYICFCRRPSTPS